MRINSVIGITVALPWLAAPALSQTPPVIAVPERSAGATTPPPEPVPAVPDGAGLPPALAPAAAPAAIVPNDPRGATDGAFGPPTAWPMIPIHTSLLPDGRVAFFGTDSNGNQGASLQFGVWDPTLGTSASSFLVLDNATRTDIFCGAQGLLASSGKLLIAAGDATYDGERNYSTPEVTLFDPDTRTLARGAQHLAHPRWYPTMITAPSGEMVVMGGQDRQRDASGADVLKYPDVPEVYTPQTGTWRTLPGAASAGAYGESNWFYPRAFTAPDGHIAILADSGEIFQLDLSGNGSIVSQGRPLPDTSDMLPAVMYAPGKVLTVRFDGAYTVDLNTTPPTASPAGKLSAMRYWSNATVLPNGDVVVSGGSPVNNELADASLRVETWSPSTGRWRLGASGQKARLYHSTAMLLPDATVLVAGGGAPGPQTNLNAEIYYPPYLYLKDGSGRPAPRPALDDVPAASYAGQQFRITTSPDTRITRMTLVKAGSVTHSFNFEQRLFELSGRQSGSSGTVTLPANRNLLTPGYYMLFLFDQNGTPSMGRMMRIE